MTIYAITVHDGLGAAATINLSITVNPKPQTTPLHNEVTLDTGIIQDLTTSFFLYEELLGLLIYDQTVGIHQVYTVPPNALTTNTGDPIVTNAGDFIVI